MINVSCPTALMVRETQGGDPRGEDDQRSWESTSTRLTYVKPTNDGTKWRIPTCNHKLNFAPPTLSWLSLNRLARIDCREWSYLFQDIQNVSDIWHNTKKVCKTRGTSEKIKKKLWFRVGGVHIDVTTLQRNAYVFWKTQDLPSKTLVLFATSQNPPLRSTLVWAAKRMNVLRVLHIFLSSKILKNTGSQTWYPPKYLAKCMIHSTLLKTSMHFAAAWWHRCAHLPREITTF